MTDHERDARDLDMLARRAAGETTISIAKLHGCVNEYVRVITNRIRNESIAAGEPDVDWWKPVPRQLPADDSKTRWNAA